MRKDVKYLGLYVDEQMTSKSHAKAENHKLTMKVRQKSQLLCKTEFSDTDYTEDNLGKLNRTLKI